MSKKPYVKELIPEIIRENGPLNRLDIHEKIISQDNEKTRIKPKSLDENILKLLKEDIISISGYQFDKYKDRMQNIRPDYIVFDVVKTLPFEIKITIKQLGSEDPKIIRDAYYDLRRLFRKKYREASDIYNNESIRWKNHLKKISVEDALSEIDGLGPLFTINEQNNVKKIKESLKKFNIDDNIWIASAINKETNFREIVKDNGIIIHQNDEILVDMKFSEDHILSVLNLKPSNDLKYIDNLFEEILDELNIDENSTHHKKLSIALSDHYNSINEFRSILNRLRESDDDGYNDTIERASVEWWISGAIDFIY